jgi:hypothetical protein
LGSHFKGTKERKYLSPVPACFTSPQELLKFVWRARRETSIGHSPQFDELRILGVSGFGQPQTSALQRVYGIRFNVFGVEIREQEKSSGPWDSKNGQKI